MKEASGELSMTAVAIVAIAAVGGIFMAFVWPNLKGSLQAKTRCQSAFNCSACSSTTGDGVKTCNGYYDEDGEAVEKELQCSC